MVLVVMVDRKQARTYQHRGEEHVPRDVAPTRAVACYVISAPHPLAPLTVHDRKFRALRAEGAEMAVETPDHAHHHRVDLRHRDGAVAK